MNKEVYDIFPTPIFQYHIEDHKEFETLLGDILVEIITESAVDENRTDNPE